AVGRLGQAMGMNVLVAERAGATTVRPGRTAFVDVLSLSDVLTLHCPLTQETRNLIDAPQLDLMKPTAILINTARGGLVNEKALINALKEGKIAGASLDVLTNEPPREGNPLLASGMPNLIVTPHVAWASEEAMLTLARQLIDNVEAFVRGESLNRVV